MKFDLHVHSKNSIDSNAQFEDIYAAAKHRGLSGIAICDHNHFQVPPHCDDLFIIPACEYSTTAGHMLTYFLKSPLESILEQTEDGKYHWKQVIEAAHTQGALVFLAHPYAPEIKRPREVWQAVDGIEVYNGRIEHSHVKDANRNAQTTCLLLDKSFSAGSDGHFPNEIGYTFWECGCEPTEESIKEALLSKAGRVHGGSARPFYRPMSQWIKMRQTKNYKNIFKILIRFVYALLHTFRRIPSKYINMEGVRKP